MLLLVVVWLGIFSLVKQSNMLSLMAAANSKISSLTRTNSLGPDNDNNDDVDGGY